MFANVSRTRLRPRPPLCSLSLPPTQVLNSCCCCCCAHQQGVCCVSGGLGDCPTLALDGRRRRWWLLCRRTYKKVIFSFLVLVRGFLYIRRNGFIYFLYVSGGKTFSLLWLCCPPSACFFFFLCALLCSARAPLNWQVCCAKFGSRCWST